MLTPVLALRSKNKLVPKKEVIDESGLQNLRFNCFISKIKDHKTETFLYLLTGNFTDIKSGEIKFSVEETFKKLNDKIIADVFRPILAFFDDFEKEAFNFDGSEISLTEYRNILTEWFQFITHDKVEA